LSGCLTTKIISKEAIVIKTNTSLLSKILSLSAIVFAICYYGVLILGNDYQKSIILISSFQQLFFALIAAFGCFISWSRMTDVKSSYLLGFALSCWALGQLYWLSYLFVGQQGLPYPSVADFGFLGCYLFIISSLQTKGGHVQVSIYPRSRAIIADSVAVVALALVIVTILYKKSFYFSDGYSIFFAIIIAYVIYLLGKGTSPDAHGGTGAGILLLALADLLLIVQTRLQEDAVFLYADPIYAVSFALILLGIHKRNKKHDE